MKKAAIVINQVLHEKRLTGPDGKRRTHLIFNGQEMVTSIRVQCLASFTLALQSMKKPRHSHLYTAMPILEYPVEGITEVILKEDESERLLKLTIDRNSNSIFIESKDSYEEVPLELVHQVLSTFVLKQGQRRASFILHREPPDCIKERIPANI